MHIGSERGFILFYTFILMAILTVIVGAFMYMTAYEVRGVGPQRDDATLEALADAGVDKAYRALRDDYDTTTQTGTADLRGGDTALSSSVTNATRISYIDSSSATFTSGTAILRAFDSNYTNTRITSIVLWARASRASGGTGSNNLVVQYTIDGSSYNAAISSTNLSATLTNYSDNITADRTWTWSTLMNSNFRVRATRGGSGSRTVNLDAIWLTVTYSIDTPTEPWSTGSYASFPITLGAGTIQSVAITDEAGKIHLNYASQALLQNFLTNMSIASASTKATDIVNYRGASLTNPFDSVEELQQVTSITASDYTALKDYVTVYSYVDPYSYNSHTVGSSPVSRTPVNVNTAPFAALKAVFDPLGLGGGDSTSLANAIITFRASTPFTCFYSNAAITTDFAGFVATQGSYLSAAEQNTVIDNADASLLAPVSGFTNATQTAEFSYTGTAFHINSLGRLGERDLRVKTIRNSAGGNTFTTYTGDTSSAGWRKENFE